MKRRWTWLITAALAMGVTLPAVAHDRHHDKGSEWRERQHREREWRREHERREHERIAWRNHNDWRYRQAAWRDDHDRRPPGWSKGKKKGWGNCDLPPGQAKKHGCRSTWYSNDRRYPPYVRRYPSARPAPRPGTVFGGGSRSTEQRPRVPQDGPPTVFGPKR